MAHDIFISYSHDDKATADAACAVLESEGLRCWIAPRDILPGTEWTESIIDAIGQSKALVLIFSKHADESPQVRREVERAIHHGIPIVPVRIEDVMPGKAMEYLISAPHWMDALSPPLEAHYRQLAASLKMLIQRQPPAPAGTPRDLPPASPVRPTERKTNTAKFVIAGGVVLACVIGGIIGAQAISHRSAAGQPAAMINPAPAPISQTPPPPPPSTAPVDSNKPPPTPAPAPTPAPPSDANANTLVGGHWRMQAVIQGVTFYAEGQFWADGSTFGQLKDGTGRIVAQGSAKYTLDAAGHYTYTGSFYEEGQITFLDKDHFIYKCLKTTNPYSVVGSEALNTRTND